MRISCFFKHTNWQFVNLSIFRPLSSQADQAVVKTVCYFCKEGGFPEILQFPSHFTPKFEYFPDFVQNLNGKLLKVAIPYIRARVEADAPWTGVGNAKRGIWKILFEQYLNVSYAKLVFTKH